MFSRLPLQRYYEQSSEVVQIKTKSTLIDTCGQTREERYEINEFYSYRRTEESEMCVKKIN